jgi:hypothetical protein
MTSTGQNKTSGKSGRRNRKGERTKKPDSQSPIEMQPIEQAVPVEMNSPEPEQRSLAEPDQMPILESQPLLSEQVDTVAASPELPSPAPAPVEVGPVSLQTIANAYRDYTRKSFAEIGSYFEQLTGVRSLDKAMTVQSEFMKRAYQTSVAESQKICELHSRLARQSLQPFEGPTNKAPQTRSKS